MGSYYIPRNYRGESRFLYIFTLKSLISTAIGAALGFFIYFILKMLGAGMVGIIIMAVFAVIGYAVGAFKIPTIAGLPVTKKIGGEPISEIILRYIKFKKNRKMYVYKREEK